MDSPRRKTCIPLKPQRFAPKISVFPKNGASHRQYTIFVTNPALHAGNMCVPSKETGASHHKYTFFAWKSGAPRRNTHVCISIGDFAKYFLQCTCYGFAVCLPCGSYAFTMDLLYICNGHAMELLCMCCGLALYLLWNGFAFAKDVLYMYLLCNCYGFA